MTQETSKPTPISAEEWFNKGQRVYFDPVNKKIVPNETHSSSNVAVFERTVVNSTPSPRSTRWITIMPGFPDGSYGFHKIEPLLEKMRVNTPRLYIEYIGQGASEKPRRQDYKYSTMERADLVEAQWRAHGIRNTVLVTFDYSSLVMLELLQRQREARDVPTTRIEHVLSINGGLFADGHSHPITTTPLLKTPLGKFGAWMAQRSNKVFDTMLKPLYSSEYGVTKRELQETEKAIRRNDGAHFLASAAGFVDEHERHANRWNLESIYRNFAMDEKITFHLVGSEKDQFEHRQIDLAKERLGKYYPQVKIERIPGGHLATSEQAGTLATMIEALANQPHANDDD